MFFGQGIFCRRRRAWSQSQAEEVSSCRHVQVCFNSITSTFNNIIFGPNISALVPIFLFEAFSYWKELVQTKWFLQIQIMYWWLKTRHEITWNIYKYIYIYTIKQSIFSGIQLRTCMGMKNEFNLKSIVLQQHVWEALSNKSFEK